MYFRQRSHWAKGPPQAMKKTGVVQQLPPLEASPSPLSSRPEQSWAKGPPKVMKNGSCSATTVVGSAALPFVISTGAPKERSGEICGPADLSWECFSTERSVVKRSAVSAVLEKFFERVYPVFLLRVASDVHVCGSRHADHQRHGFPQENSGERSGENCVLSGPFLEIFSIGSC